MSVTILDKRSDLNGVGASFRGYRCGPEHDLVQDFLAASKIRYRRNCRATVFREPKIESGFPDLVIVVWQPSIAKKWHPARALLTVDDIRLIHLLVSEGGLTQDELDVVFPKTSSASLIRLAAADMVRKVGKRWVGYKLSRLLATRDIIAIEAKMTDFRAAIEQAYLNTWFASSSFILMPRSSSSGRLAAEANSLGIGVHEATNATFDVSGIEPIVTPRSYVSWLFNEWAWRASLTKSGIDNECKTISGTGYEASFPT